MISGEQFKRLRLSRGLSLVDVGNYIGKSKQVVSMFEHSDFTPNDELYDKLIEAVYKAKKGEKRNEEEVPRKCRRVVSRK